MENEERFLKNLERWKISNPLAANLLHSFKGNELEICKDEDGELNLRTKTDPPAYFHSNVSPEREARQWFLNLNLYDISVLYVFGIGLGYYYDVVKPWLKENPQRYVVFLEDNLEVIHRFLETERASDFLENPQAKLYYFNIDSTFLIISFITSIFSLSPFTLAALKFYYKTRPTDLSELYSRISYLHNTRTGFAANYYQVLVQAFLSIFTETSFCCLTPSLNQKCLSNLKEFRRLSVEQDPFRQKYRCFKNLTG